MATLTNVITERGENLILAQAKNDVEHGDLVFYWPGPLKCLECHAEASATSAKCEACGCGHFVATVVRYAPPKRERGET